MGLLTLRLLILEFAAKKEDKMISAKRIDKIFQDCLFKYRDEMDKHIRVSGAMRDIGFHSDRLISHWLEITYMLNELNHKLQNPRENTDWRSFVKAGNKHNNRQVNINHQQTLEKLYQLGIGIKKAKSPFQQHKP